MVANVIVENISKRFTIKQKRIGADSDKKSIQALNKISFEVEEGEMIGIIGKNGSGKTTLLRTIAGIYQPDSGKIKIKGILAPLLQIGIGFQNDLTALENVQISGMLLGLSKKEIQQRFDEIFSFAELDDFRGMKLRQYSSGMKTRLAFSTALQINPDILLVDEILSVGDKFFKEKSYQAFLEFKKNRKTIIYTSHNLESHSKLCDRVILLEKGEISIIGKPDQVIKKYKENKKE